MFMSHVSRMHTPSNKVSLRRINHLTVKAFLK